MALSKWVRKTHQTRSRKQLAGERGHTLQTRRLDRALSWTIGAEIDKLEIKHAKLGRARRLARRRRRRRGSASKPMTEIGLSEKAKPHFGKGQA